MKGIIIEGVASSGKTSILKHLHAKISEQFPASTKLFISEHYTERMLEHLKESKKLSGLYIKNHIGRVVDNLENYQDMLNKSKFASNPKSANAYVTLERFILTYLSSSPIEKEYSLNEAKQHFKKLNNMGIKQVVLTIPQEHFKERLLSTLKYRNDTWKEHLYSRGNEDEVIAYYLKWQEEFLDYADKFKDSIDTLIVEIKDTDYKKYSDLIFNHCFNENGHIRK